MTPANPNHPKPTKTQRNASTKDIEAPLVV